jgi:hypothetical protein
VKERSVWSNTGPVPVRDLLGQRDRGAEVVAGSEAGAVPGAEAGVAAGSARRFDVAGEVWLAREAGAGCYGTGRQGTARLLAVHFFREESPGEPVREALIPAAAFGALRAEEWVGVWSGATPIEAAG